MCTCTSGECSKTKLSVCSLGFALGVTKGLWLLLAAWVAYFFGYGVAMVEHVASFYHGYSATLMGGLWGGLYGLICGFIFGVVIGYFYNFAVCYCHRKCENKDESK